VDPFPVDMERCETAAHFPLAMDAFHRSLLFLKSGDQSPGFGK
jgi:hypothetical protein